MHQSVKNYIYKNKHLFDIIYSNPTSIKLFFVLLKKRIKRQSSESTLSLYFHKFINQYQKVQYCFFSNLIDAISIAYHSFFNFKHRFRKM